MAENAAWQLEDFVDSLVVELDKTRETLAVKAINRPLSYTVKDLELDLNIFPTFDGDRVSFDGSRGNPLRECLPDPAQRSGGGEMAMPPVLRVCERPRIAELPPKEERVEGHDRQREREPHESARTVARAPRQQRERGQQCE